VKHNDEVKVKVWNRNVARLKYKVLVNVTKYYNEVQVICYDPAIHGGTHRHIFSSSDLFELPRKIIVD